MTVEDRPDPGTREVDLEVAAFRAAHEELSARDRIVGLEATVERLERELDVERRRVRRLRRRLAAAEPQAPTGPARGLTRLKRAARRLAGPWR